MIVQPTRVSIMSFPIQRVATGPRDRSNLSTIIMTVRTRRVCQTILISGGKYLLAASLSFTLGRLSGSGPRRIGLTIELRAIKALETVNGTPVGLGRVAPAVNRRTYSLHLGLMQTHRPPVTWSARLSGVRRLPDPLAVFDRAARLS